MLHSASTPRFIAGSTKCTSGAIIIGSLIPTITMSRSRTQNSKKSSARAKLVKVRLQAPAAKAPLLKARAPAEKAALLRAKVRPEKALRLKLSAAIAARGLPLGAVTGAEALLLKRCIVADAMEAVLSIEGAEATGVVQFIEAVQVVEGVEAIEAVAIEAVAIEAAGAEKKAVETRNIVDS